MLKQYFALPGLIGERLFEIMSKEKNGFIVEEDFIFMMSKMYSSSIQEKELLIFKMYIYHTGTTATTMGSLLKRIYSHCYHK
jgi:hypothetical protein